jgi:hypothetical protein
VNPYWVRWEGAGAFTWEGPWWESGWFDRENSEGDEEDVPIFCAAVMARDAAHAESQIRAAHDNGQGPSEFSFVNERVPGWSPFCDRFQRADWMKWPYPEEPEPESPATA